MGRYSFIIAGGGAAGLSLAHHLISSPLRNDPILILDHEPKERNDRTWSFWAREPTELESIVYRSWEHLGVALGGRKTIIPLNGYRYQTIRGIDFYRYIHHELAECPNVQMVTGEVDRIEDTSTGARVSINGAAFEGDWVFDSISTASAPPHPELYHQVEQEFFGIELTTVAPVFDARVATFLDFRTAQRGGIRFFYVLPYSETRALVEYVAICGESPTSADAAAARSEYFKSIVGIDQFHVEAVERGASLLGDRHFPRRRGRRIMAIGALGGRLKPSSGYAFTRIQRDSLAIVRSLIETGQPFGVPSDSPRYRLFDSLLLELMADRPAVVEEIFGALFERNPIERVLRFLDETGSIGENLQLIATMPAVLFLGVTARSRALRRFSRYGPRGI